MSTKKQKEARDTLMDGLNRMCDGDDYDRVRLALNKCPELLSILNTALGMDDREGIRIESSGETPDVFLGFA